jgi:phosphatidylglycerophosphate synthase
MMSDTRVRTALAPSLARVTTSIDVPWVSPHRLTAVGVVLGLASALTAALQLWWAALALWLVSRACDGLDGTLARHRAGSPTDHASSSHAGGFLDITADFTVYGATVVGVAWGATRGEGAYWLPFLLVLFAYYVNGTALLAFSSIAERMGRRLDDGRSLSFLGGIAQGTQTIAVHSFWLILPQWAGAIASVWAVVVGISAAQRVTAGYRALR